MTYRGEIYSIDDDNEVEMMLKDGASRQDIDLTNYGMIYKEDEMIRLLRSGASPYFLDKRYFDDEDCDCYYSYKEVAPLQSFHEMAISDQWKFTPEARKKGEELMKEYCEYVYPILRHNSKEQ